MKTRLGDETYENGMCGTRRRVHWLRPTPSTNGETPPWCGSTDRSLPAVPDGSTVNCRRCLTRAAVADAKVPH